jgi:hypothetical protein
MSENQSVKQIQSLDEVLKTMKRVNESFAYEVWIPSISDTLRFKEINTAQQKRLVKSVIDSEVYKTEFIGALRDIIKENCADDINTDDLTVIDKLCIALHMRAISIGGTLDLEIPIPGEEVATMQYSVDLNEILDKLKSVVSTPETITVEDGTGKYSIKCSVPSIGTEYKLERELRTDKEEEAIATAEELRNLLGDVFSSEICKYVSALTVQGEDGVMDINLSGITFKDRIKIIEQLPIKVIKEVMSFIEKVKQEINKITIINVEIDGQESFERRLDVDSGFFTNF